MMLANSRIITAPAARRSGAVSFTLLAAALISLATWILPSMLWAQQREEGGLASSLLEEVVVTARKREELSQSVPIAITAYNSDQLDALKFRDLGNLSVKMPNVALDDIGTFRTVANFSIRGLGINSSIPSIDPTVGVFIDGVYMGQNAGVVIDMSDIQSIEVLRGPQGTLFGRNVTGGAILINTKRPTEELDFSAKVAVDGNPNGDGGLNKYVMAGIGGPLSDSFGARVSFYHNDDDGWFVNLFNGENFGKAETTIFRPVLSWQPNDDVEIFLRWEHMRSEGQGPASQTHTNGLGIPGFFANFDRDSFDFAIDEEGFYEFESDLVSLEINWDVAFGDGTITGIFGWKDYTSEGLSDIDAQPVWIFHAPFWNDQEQFSYELRYTGSFGNTRVTTGVYWFDNEINYHERRNLLGIATGGVAPALVQDGGGNYNVESKAWFGSVDYDINEAWTLTAGARYTSEEKDAEVASLIFNVNTSCNVVLNPGGCTFDFVDDASWNAWSGKLGATWTVRNDLRFYAHWSQSQRSGGYNLRNTSLDIVNQGPGPFDEETVTNYELGMKTELGGRGRLNAAVFYTEVDDMQREINLTSPITGVVQFIKNTADADIWGFEVEGTFAVGRNTVLQASLGWINPEYKEIFEDLNVDGVIDQADKDLEPPRAAEWTWSVGATHDFRVGDWGYLSARVNYAFRDDSFYTDNNLGYLLSQKILDAGLDFRTPAGHWTYSIYGRNLLNEVSHGGDTQLSPTIGPIPTGGTFSPLAKGRIVGLEIAYKY